MSIPFPSPLETERLVIRTPTAEDAKELNDAIRETRQILEPWMPWAKEMPSLEESREKCISMAADAAVGTNRVLFGFNRTDGRFVLATGAHMKDPEVPFYEIGYWCRASYQGKGYVTEAVRAITSTCFEVLGARRVQIRCDEGNRPSIAVAERCGFPLEARLINECRDLQGRLSNTLIFALTRPDGE